MAVQPPGLMTDRPIGAVPIWKVQATSIGKLRRSWPGRHRSETTGDFAARIQVNWSTRERATEVERKMFFSGRIRIMTSKTELPRTVTSSLITLETMGST